MPLHDRHKRRERSEQEWKEQEVTAEKVKEILI
jgi:hypothetical protein